MAKKADQNYFKNLDGLRFIAATMVVFGHCQSVHFNRAKISSFSPYFNKMASFGVDFFFVLSGFLITFLLINEIDKTGTLNVKNFLIRRALRLWPLYFIIGIISISTAPFLLQFYGEEFQPPSSWEQVRNYLYLLTFSINHQILIGDMNVYTSDTVGHFWSLSIEEQFYLLWAPCLLLFRKHLIQVIFMFIAIGFLSNFLPNEWWHSLFGKNDYAAPYYFTTHRFFHFGLGALLSWLFYYKKSLFDVKWKVWFFYLVQVLFWFYFLRYLLGAYYYDAQERWINGIFSFFIIYFAVHQRSLLYLEYAWIKHFGKISFGIYIFHLSSVMITWRLLHLMHISPALNYFMYLFLIVSLVFSISIAEASYRWIELPFLKLKDRFRK